MYSKSKIPKPTSSAKGDEAKKSKSKQSASAKKSSSTAPKLQPAAQDARPAKTASASRPPKTGSYAKIQSKVAQLIHGKKNPEKKAKPSRIPVPVHRIQHAPVQAVAGGSEATAEEAKASRNTLKQTQSEGDSQNQQQQQVAQSVTRSAEVFQSPPPKKSALPVPISRVAPPHEADRAPPTKIPSLRPASPVRAPAKAEAMRRRASSQGRLSFKKSRSRSPAKPSARACSATAARESSDSDSDAGARKQQVSVPAVKRSAQTQTLYSMLLFESRSNERLERERKALQQMQQRASPKKAASNPHMDRLKILQYENSPRHSPVDARHAVSQATRSTSPPRRLSPTRQALTRLMSPLASHRSNRVAVEPIVRAPPAEAPAATSARSNAGPEALTSHRSSLGCLDMTSSRYDDDLLRDVLRYTVESSDVTTDEPFSEDSIESPSRASLTPNKNLPYHIKFGVSVLPQVSDFSPLRALQKQALRPASPAKVARESEISDTESESDMSVTSDEVDNLASSVLDRYDRERHPPKHPTADELRLDLREDDVESWVLCSSSEDSILGGSSVDKPPKAMRRKMRQSRQAHAPRSHNPRRSPSYTVRARHEFPTYPECRRTFDVIECESTVDDFLYSGNELDNFRHNDAVNTASGGLLQRLAHSVESAWSPENSLQLMNMFSSFGDVISTLPVLLIVGAQRKKHRGSPV